MRLVARTLARVRDRSVACRLPADGGPASSSPRNTAATSSRLMERPGTGGSEAWMVTRVACALMSLILIGGSGLDVAETRGQEAQPSAQAGTISGVILDKRTGDPIADAGVEVVGQGKSTRTDLDGKYSIRIEPGTYEVRVFAA